MGPGGSERVWEGPEGSRRVREGLEVLNGLGGSGKYREGPEGSWRVQGEPGGSGMVQFSSVQTFIANRSALLPRSHQCAIRIELHLLLCYSCQWRWSSSDQPLQVLSSVLHFVTSILLSQM